MAIKKYKLWDKTSPIITPVGEVLSPDKWISRYPVANVLPTVVSGGTINGAFFGVYPEMIEMYEKLGCDFSECTTEQEHLDAIEVFEESRNTPDGTYISAEERIAAALEAQVMMSMPDDETEVV